MVTGSNSMESLIDDIPKVELHLHIEGTLEPELMLWMAERNGLTLPFRSVAEARQAYEFEDLQSFLNLYYRGAQVLRYERDFYQLTWDYLTRVHAQNVRHVEVFFDPQTHTSRGVSFEDIVTGIHRALSDAREQLGMSSQLIMCFLRDRDVDEAMATLLSALPFKDWIVGVGLDSAEMGNPPEKFTKVFEKALEEQMLTVAHAGEEGPPDYVWQALDRLKVSRIDHGVRCMEDSYLVDRLVDLQIPLTVCPISNVRLRVFDNMRDHNLKLMLDRGLLVTVNSDDPAYFGGYLTENYLAAQEALALDRRDIYRLAKNSYQATFLTPQEKQVLMRELDQVMSKHE